MNEHTQTHTHTMIDVILTNSPSLIKKNGVFKPICSDHKPIYSYLNFTYTKSQPFKRTVWDFRIVNFNIFRAELSHINWEFIDIIDDINIISDMLTNKFMEVAKSTIPNKECIIRGKDKPWMHNCKSFVILTSYWQMRMSCIKQGIFTLSGAPSTT